MGPGKAALFGICIIAAGFFVYRCLYRSIEVGAHSLPGHGLSFWVNLAAAALLFATALKVAWKPWKGWSVPFALFLTALTVVVLVVQFWLPFP